MTAAKRAAQPHLRMAFGGSGLTTTVKRRRAKVKYKIRDDIKFAPWAASMRPGYLALLGDDELGETAVDLLASQLAPSSYKTYATGVASFFEFCSETGDEPLEATAVDIVRYLAWLARRGTVAGTSLQPYLSAINKYFSDHLVEPVALGPLVAAAKAGYKQNQVVLVENKKRVYLPAAVAFSVLRWAERLLAQPVAPLPELRAAAAVLVNYVFFNRGNTGALARTEDLAVDASAVVLLKRNAKGMRGVLADRLPVVQVPAAAHNGRLAAVVSGYLAARAAACSSVSRPVPVQLWGLPGEDTTSWCASTVTDWLRTCVAAVQAAPPSGFDWTSHSLRSGPASAASAAGVPLPKIRHFGGWSTNSYVVERDYIDPGCLCDAAAMFFFGWLTNVSVRGAPSGSS